MAESNQDLADYPEEEEYQQHIQSSLSSSTTEQLDNSHNVADESVEEMQKRMLEMDEEMNKLDQEKEQVSDQLSSVAGSLDETSM
jgi:chemotaxis protein histidine kinase CheA